MKRLLIVVDYQNDFVCGSLGFDKAKELEKGILEKIAEYQNDEIIYTLDTHFDDYLTTAEGKSLPVPHCIKGTVGHKLYGGLADALKGNLCFEKNTFPSLEMAKYLETVHKGKKAPNLMLKKINKIESFRATSFGRKFINFFINEYKTEGEEVE